MKTGETVQRGGKEVDRSVYDLWPSKKRKTIKEKEMVERLIFSMVNEATRCLDEKIARSTRDIDMALIMGTGFPPFHGGLIRYANHLGLAKIVERLKVYEERYGTRFKPHEKLVSLAKENKTL
jgi:3-hydroxyacyl-CoA dehydrogenase/enoyl-CoA hydratase/3-hydroxybutyryl-CoA epimerase